jgi:hypothetical protein
MFSGHLFKYFKENLKNSNANYLEIGVYNGDSIHLLADEYPNKIIVGVDPFIEDGYTSWTSKVKKDDSLVAQKNATLNGIESRKNIKFYEMTSEEFSNNLTEELIQELNVKNILIDGDHHYSTVVIDYKLALKLIGNDAGVVAFDDTNINDIKDAMHEFEELVKDRIESSTYINPNGQVYVLKSI